MNDTLKYLQERYSILDMSVDRFVVNNQNRKDLAKLFFALGFMKGAEIGVEQGEYSETLLSANKLLTLYSIDAWKAYNGYTDHTRQEKLDRFFEATEFRLQKFEKRSVISRLFSLEAAKLFQDNYLDFVYIDANHDFLHVTQDIYHWSKKVKPGGIIAGHDYVSDRSEAPHVHVREVLEGYCKAYGIRPLFVLGTDQSYLAERRDAYRSWFFVKQ